MMDTCRVTAALGILDLHGIHRDIVGYYRQFGFLNSSTSSDLADVILRNCIVPIAVPATPGHGLAQPVSAPQIVPTAPALVMRMHRPESSSNSADDAKQNV